MPERSSVQGWSCGCFRKVYVCPEHLLAFEMELEALTDQRELGRLDSVVSVSVEGEGEVSRSQLPLPFQG